MKKNIVLLYMLLISSISFAQWERVNNGLPFDVSNAFIRQIKAIHNLNGTLFVANAYGHLAKSTDGGANWSPFTVPTFPASPYVYKFTSIGNRLFAGLLNNGVTGGVYYSDDDGATFTLAGTGLHEGYNIFLLVEKDGVLYAGTQGLFVSSDNGQTWTSKSSGFSFLMGVSAITFDNAGTIYIGGSFGRIFKSTDGGNNWLEISNGLPTSSGGVSSMAYINGNLIASVGSEGMYVSSDDGENWIPATGITASNHKPVTDFIIVGSDIITASPGGGAFISYDDGFTWSAYNVGAEGGLICFTTKDNYIYAGGNTNGVHRREMTTVSVDDELIENSFTVMQNYPNPFNPATTINYTIPTQSHVSIKVYDVLGKEVASLVNEMKAPGNHHVQFSASNFASGVYFYKVSAANFFEVKKMILSK